MKEFIRYLPFILILEIVLIIFLHNGKFPPDNTPKAEVRVVKSQELWSGTTATVNPKTKKEVPVIIETEGLKLVPPSAPSTYIKIVDGCGPYFSGTCINVRAGPSTSSPKTLQLRNGMVLKTSEKVTDDGREWYKIAFDDWLRYPERVSRSWYVAADLVTAVTESEQFMDSKDIVATGTKRILVDRSEQTLYAYNGDTLFMEEKISTGLDGTPTPRGTFPIFRKTPSRYMQGPLPGISTQYFDLPGVPWTMYFTEAGGAIHGAYWHDKFGKQWSHGCVNLPPEKAEILYHWAELGTPVTVRD